MSTAVAEAFARAVAAKDHERLRALLHEDLDFRAMTPGRVWEGSDPDAVLAALDQWFDQDDAIEEVVSLDLDEFADRERVGYRFRVRNPAGEHLVEQQAYLSVRADRIAWLRVMCSGFRPLA